jgi:HlyD family type I secretion membrane fusion protein
MSAPRSPRADAGAPSSAPAPRAPFGAGLILGGLAILATFGGVLAAWMALAPLASAVIAPGVVGVDSNLKKVQHFEGGIVEQILVREGDRVQAGDVLFRLEDTVAISVVNELQAQFFEAQATEARLMAERDGADRIGFPLQLHRKVADEAVQEAMRGQRSIFESRRTLLRERLAILERTIAGLEQEIIGLDGQIRSAEAQMALLDEELAAKRELLRRELARKPQVLALQRERMQLDSTVSDHQAGIATARQKIEEARLRRAELQAAATAEVDAQLREVRGRAYELTQQLAAALDVLRRTEIRAPIDGTVVGLAVHTVGGVIAPGEQLMGIVPRDDELVVLASIDPLDIDQLSVGLPATVQLSALNRRTHAPLEGELTTISADVITDPTSGEPYYLGRVELSGDASTLGVAALQPGMSAEVMVRTGIRSPWEYLVTPITRTMARSLREE